MLSAKQLENLSNHCRSKLTSLFDPAVPFAEQKNLHAELNFPHKGFYIGVVDAEGNDVCRSGFLKDAVNVCDSADAVVSNLHNDLKAKNIPVSQVHSSSFYFTVVTDVRYMSDPLSWNEETDGVYFMWGQDYRGLYLPYQIKRAGIPKVKILDRLCTWEAGVASNLWRLPEGLCWVLSCQSHSA